jgi:hypothetical protein
MELNVNRDIKMPYLFWLHHAVVILNIEIQTHVYIHIGRHVCVPESMGLSLERLEDMNEFAFEGTKYRWLCEIN